MVAAADLDSFAGTGQGVAVVDKLLGEGRILYANVGLSVNVIWTDVVSSRLRKRQIEFELPDLDRERIGGQFEKAAEVDESQVSVAQSAIGVGARDANVVVDPEG